MDNMRPILHFALWVVAIMSGITSLIREVLQFVDPIKYPEKSLFYACLRVACIVALALLWWQEKRARIVAEALLQNSKPRLELGLGNVLWLYRADKDLTVFFVLANVLNRGEPSVTLNWSARYLLNGNTEAMELFQIFGTYDVTVDDQVIHLTNDNLLNLKTLETPIQKGQWVGGRILCTVKGNRTEQIKAVQYAIEVTCEDFLGTKTTAIYKPSSAPAGSLTLHFREKTEKLHTLANDPNAPPAAPAPLALPDNNRK